MSKLYNSLMYNWIDVNYYIVTSANYSSNTFVAIGLLNNTKYFKNKDIKI